MKISIITVTNNSAKTIKDTIDSIAIQKYFDVEHIIVDNVSTDDTINIVKKYSIPNTRIYIEKDSGIYHAMNKGISFAKGNIIGFLNSDDFYANNDVLNSVAELFKKDSLLKACYSDLVYVDENDIFKNVRFWKSSPFNKGNFLKGWCPPHCTFFTLRSVYESYGQFNLNYKLAADFELLMRFLEVNKIKSQYVSKVWIKMRLGGATNKNFRNIWLQNLEIINALKNYNLQPNYIDFFYNKFLSRIKQLLIKKI